MNYQSEHEPKRARTDFRLSIMWLSICLGIVVGLLAKGLAADERGMDLAILHLIRDAPNHRLQNEETRWGFEDAIVDVSEKRRVPKSLILTVSFLESSMDTHRIGYKRKEVGLMQVHGLAAKGCDLRTQYGQLDCGAKWMEVCMEKCGTWRGALTAYATGKCKTRNTRVRNIISYRIMFWKKIQRIMGEIK